MFKHTLFALFTLGTFTMSAQSYIGFLNDNYSGVHGLISNPANIVDTRFKTDINLVGVSALVGNDYFGAKLSTILKDDFDFDRDAIKSPSAANNVFGNIDVLGPSFLFNINKRNSIAIFTRGRVYFNVNEINGQTFENIVTDLDETTDYSINEGDFYANANAWEEIGITYASVLMNKNEHFIKGGISLKYLQGYANGYAVGENVTVDYDADGISLPGGSTTGSIASTGRISYGYSNDFQDYEFEKGATGFGLDLGAVYEWRPQNYIQSNASYKLKLGISITDLGGMNYKDGDETIYDITNSVSEEDFENTDGFKDLLDSYYTEVQTGNCSKAILPTAFHFNADLSLNPKFYLNLNTDFSLTSKTKVNSSSVLNIVSLTPRFESKWFSFYSPISILQYTGFQWGAGMRLGPLYVGSGSILSVLLKDEIMGADIYAGLKIPLYRKNSKEDANDTDGDGILNIMDGCPKKPGPPENDGCPIDKEN